MQVASFKDLHDQKETEIYYIYYIYIYIYILTNLLDRRRCSYYIM